MPTTPEGRTGGDAAGGSIPPSRRRGGEKRSGVEAADRVGEYTCGLAGGVSSGLLTVSVLCAYVCVCVCVWSVCKTK